MTSTSPAAHFAAPLSPSHLGRSVDAQRLSAALWLSLADQADVWAVLEQLSETKLSQIGSTALAVSVDRAIGEHERGVCTASCGFCPRPVPAGEVTL